MKFYAVKEGRVPGIYATWAECKAQTDGYSGAVYKSFASRAEAERFVLGEAESAPRADGTRAAAYVDGSYNIRTGEFGCGAVLFWCGEMIEFSQKFADCGLAAMRNVAGEIKGAELVLTYCAENGIPAVDIYYDYEGIAAWAQGRWKTNREGTAAYKAFFDAVKEKIDVRFVKVKGHSGDKYNDRADRLAKDAVGNA